MGLPNLNDTMVPADEAAKIFFSHSDLYSGDWGSAADADGALFFRRQVYELAMIGKSGTNAGDQNVCPGSSR